MAAVPQKIGKYQIDSLLGKGGMGEVYKAHDVALGRFVALKVMRGPALDDANARERFVREAQSAGGLRHPNIVTVYDLGEFEDRMFIAMEFIHGEDLEHLIRKKSRLTIDDKFNIMIQVCEGVSYAHKHQIIHRDLKPSNIRIDDEGIAKIMDFGIAKLESSNMTASGTVMGTPFYMSPEQVRGMRVDQRSDVFSLGAILYELFSYKKAFEGELATVFFKIVQEQPPPISLSLPSEPLQEIINGCLEKDKNKRIGSVDELIATLNKAHQWYAERGMLAVTGLEDDAQASIATFHMAPTPAAVKQKTLTHPSVPPQPPPPGSSAPTQLMNQQITSNQPVSSAPTEFIQNQQPQTMPPPIPQIPSPSMTVAETVPRPASSKAPLIIIALLIIALAASVIVYFFVLRHPAEPIVKNPEPKKETSKTQRQDSGLQAQISEGKSLHQQGRYEDAVKIYTEALAKNPKDSELHFLMGASKKSLGKSQEALLEFQRAVELEDRNQQAWEQIGDLLMNRMDYGGAERAFLKSAELDPSAAPTWEGLAQTYLIQQKSQQAEEAYEKLLSIEPNNVTAIYNLGLLQNGSNKKEAARESFQKVISLNPNYAEAYNNLGAIDLYDGKVPQAIQELEKALALKPELGSAHYSLFLAYEMQKNYPQAAEHLKRYIDLTGDDDPALKKKLEQYSR